MRKKSLLAVIILILNIFIISQSYGAASDTSGIKQYTDEEMGSFKHCITFSFMSFMTGITIGLFPIPLRYELGFPNSQWGLVFYNGILFRTLGSRGTSFYDEIRVGPRYQFTGSGLNGLFVRPLAIIGFGSIPYSFKENQSANLVPTSTFLYGLSAELGYTLILDIGFTVEAAAGIGYAFQSFADQPVPNKWVPIFDVSVGWTF
jgi:hypothetical protein